MKDQHIVCFLAAARTQNISLAAQESASNLFSGIVILLDKPFSIGDWITVGNVEGEVIDINFRSTRIRSMDHSVIIITNSQICASTVQNAALRTMRPYKFTLGVTYNTTRPQLEQHTQQERGRHRVAYPDIVPQAHGLPHTEPQPDGAGDAVQQ